MNHVIITSAAVLGLALTAVGSAKTAAFEKEFRDIQAKNTNRAGSSTTAPARKKTDNDISPVLIERCSLIQPSVTGANEPTTKAADPIMPVADER